MINKIEKPRVFDENVQLTNNAMLKEQTYLFYEWNFERNDELGLDIYKITKGSNKTAWWRCSGCDSGYDMAVYNRTGKTRSSCPYCAGKRVNHTNSLASLRPDIAKEWHPTLNGDLTPDDVTAKNNKKVWWFCELGHEWKTRVSHRTISKSNCPYCSNQKILIGFNDMWTTNPELAKRLADPVDGYKYTQGSNKKVDWKCLDCSNTIRNKNIASVKEAGLCCLICTSRASVGERIMYSLLIHLGTDFKHEASFKWSENKRYDFYLYDTNTIIEVHGNQHYAKGFENVGGDTVEEVQENDKYKYKLALKNGINNYIVIDARESGYRWIMNSIEDSNMIELLNITEEKLDSFKFDANSSRIKDTWELWNSGIKNRKVIESTLKISQTSVQRYLKLGRELNIIS